MILLRVDASLRSEGSTSRAVADSVQAAWQAEHPDGQVVVRDLGQAPFSIETWALAAAASRSVPADEWTDEHKQAIALAKELADEVLAADAYLFAAPLYNFGVPAALKVWIDILLTQPELGPYGSLPLAGRPGVLVIARGGGYGANTPRAGWDHATPWLQRIFADVFKLQLRTIEAELTLAKFNPAMAGLIGLSEQSLADAHTAAELHGRELVEIARQAPETSTV